MPFGALAAARPPCVSRRHASGTSRAREVENVFQRILPLHIGHRVLLLEQILFNIAAAGLLQLSNSETGNLSLQPKQFRLLLEVRLSIVDPGGPMISWTLSSNQSLIVCMLFKLPCSFRRISGEICFHLGSEA